MQVAFLYFGPVKRVLRLNGKSEAFQRGTNIIIPLYKGHNTGSKFNIESRCNIPIKALNKGIAKNQIANEPHKH